MKLKSLFFILPIFLILSCGKEVLPFQKKTISELTLNMQSNIKKASEIRLAFGIAVANAMEDISFRNYIKNISSNNTDSIYKEILFALHKDDIVACNTTLAQYINMNINDEIKNMFGDQFIQKVLQEDPLVCIKIPDVFWGFDWETDKYAPMVAIKTPMGVGSNNNTEYIGFHYSGFYDYFPHLSQKDYFTIVVKYSEDYILCDTIVKRNEKNISLFELIPQLEKSWAKMSSFIKQNGVKYLQDNQIIYLNRREILKEYIKQCEQDYTYYGENAIKDCHAECLKDCIDENTEINDVFEKITVLNPLFMNISTSFFFQDNFDVFFFIYLPDGNIIDKYTLCGVRKKEYYGTEVTFTKNISKEYYEEIGKVELPRLKINRKYTKNKDVYFNHRWRNAPKSESGDVLHNFSVVSYSDIVNQWHIEYSKTHPALVINCTENYLIDQSPLHYCIDPNFKEYYNLINIGLIYRY